MISGAHFELSTPRDGLVLHVMLKRNNNNGFRPRVGWDNTHTFFGKSTHGKTF